MIQPRALALPMLAACAAALLLGSAWSLLHERIGYAERTARAAIFAELLPRARFDNSPGDDTTLVADITLLGYDSERQAYIARLDGRIEALFLPLLAANGYAGAIELLVGIDRDGAITGVRVLAQHETPGMGAQIDPRHSNWLLQFVGRSLRNPEPQRWAVRRDGGEFDQLTGATVTSRAVTGALEHALQYTAANPGLFAGERHE